MRDHYFETEEFRELLTKYEVATQRGDSVYLEADELSDIADYYHQHGRTEEALAACDYALCLFPGATAPTVFKARAAMVLGNDLALAHRLLDSANDKRHLEYYDLTAELLLNENKTEEAKAFLEDTYRQLDDEDDKADFVINAASLYADYDLYDEAQHWLDRSDEADEADYRELKARIAVARGNYDEGEDILNGLIDEDPYDGQYWNHLASSQLMRNQMKDAIDSTDFSIAINPDDQEAIYTKSQALFALNQFEDAYEWFDRYCRLNPSDQNGWLYRGLTLMNLERIEEAEESFQEAERQPAIGNETLLQIYQEHAFALARLGREKEAERYIQLSMPLATDNEQRLELLVLHGHTLLENGHMAKAQQLFQQAVNESRQSPAIYLRIAVSLLDSGYPRMAYKLFRLVLDNQDNARTEGYAFMALCCYDLHHRDEYLAYLRKAVEVNPDEASLILCDIFPSGLPVTSYVEYATAVHLR